MFCNSLFVFVLDKNHHVYFSMTSKKEKKQKQKTLDSQGKNQNSKIEKNKTKRPSTRKGESMKHIARKCSRTREQCVEAHVHTSLELCAVLTQVAVVLLLAHSNSIPEVP